MVVALVLGTILLATLMGVLRRSFSEIAFAIQDDPSIQRTGLLADQLRRDLANARRMRVGSNRFELVGFGHRDPRTLVATLRPARVIYEIRQDGKRSLLARIQIEDGKGTASFSSPFVEPVHFGAATMMVSTNEVRGFSQLGEMAQQAAELSSNASRGGSVPSSIQIAIADQRGRMIFDQTFTRERDNR